MAFRTAQDKHFANHLSPSTSAPTCLRTFWPRQNCSKAPKHRGTVEAGKTKCKDLHGFTKCSRKQQTLHSEIDCFATTRLLLGLCLSLLLADLLLHILWQAGERVLLRSHGSSPFESLLGHVLPSLVGYQLSQ